MAPKLINYREAGHKAEAVDKFFRSGNAEGNLKYAGYCLEPDGGLTLRFFRANAPRARFKLLAMVFERPEVALNDPDFLALLGGRWEAWEVRWES